MKRKKFYVTTAIDYVNSNPHIGHAYEKIVTDVLARWHRLRGEDVFFLTGTDENAQKNAEAAKEAGIPVKKFVDKNVEVFKGLCKKLDISHDYFIRTTEQRHVKFSKWVFQRLYDKGLIYKDVYNGLYCVGCEEYKTEKDLVNGKCPEHGTKPEERNEENYFFKMSKFTKQILKLASTKGFIVPEKRRNEILSRVKADGLRDLCVSRKELEWGIKTPIDPAQTIYVWIDALSNYVSALDYPGGKKYKKYWPADIHVIGKGINWFHSVIWPSILIAAKIPVPKQIFVHGYVNIAGHKISKSLGMVVDPIDIVEKYGADQLRYFLVKEIPAGDDGDFSEEALVSRINGELVSDLGNLLYRVLTLVEKYGVKLEGKPELEKKLNLKKIDNYFEKLELHNAIEEVWTFIRASNKYTNEKEPWKLHKEGKTKELSSVMYNLVEALRVTGILVSPFMPKTAEEICKQLDCKLGKLKDCKFGKVNYKPKKGKYLFEKVEFEEEKTELKEVKVKVDKDVQKLGVKVKTAVFSGVKVKKKHEGLERLKTKLIKGLDLNKLEKSKILKGYGKIYYKISSDIKNPIQGLIEILKKSGKLPRINTVVDSYNLVAIKRQLSVGAHDIDKIKGNVRFKITDGSENYTPLGTSQKQKLPNGEYACVDKEKVMCRLDIKQGDQTKITPNTKNIFLYVQGNSETSDKYLEDALKEICQNIVKFCGGEFKIL